MLAWSEEVLRFTLTMSLTSEDDHASLAISLEVAIDGAQMCNSFACVEWDMEESRGCA